MSETIEQASAEKKKAAPFIKCRDSRGRDIDGLWQRNERFYLQIRLSGKGCRRVPLLDEDGLPVTSVPTAVIAKAELLAQMRRGEMPGPRITPQFNAYVKHYITWVEETEAKSSLTILKERSALKGWALFLGTTRLNQITRKQINDYVLKRKKEGTGNRTINLDVLALKHVLVFAKDEGWLKHKLPTEDWSALDYTAPVRPLWTRDHIDAICNEALRHESGEPVYVNGQKFADWIRLMQWSGARHTAALSATWDRVNWEKKTITYFTKYSKLVTVDFNDFLETILKDMFSRRDESSKFLFPGGNTLLEKGHWTRMSKTLAKVLGEVIKKHPELTDFTPHDLRHFFTSWAVMAGIDYLTIANWLGHSDGGILIGEVYGHLDPKHAQEAAKKFNLKMSPAPTIAAVPDQSALLQQVLAELQQVKRQLPAGKGTETQPRPAPSSSAQPSGESSATPPTTNQEKTIQE